MTAPRQETTTLTTPLTHPEMLAALGRAGHGGTVLIADGNYPTSTRSGPRAVRVALNLAPGVVRATDVLAALAGVVPFEAAWVMRPLRSGPYAIAGEPGIWAEFRRVLSAAGCDVELEQLERFAFYERASADDLVLAVATGEPRFYGNLLLRIGAVELSES